MGNKISTDELIWTEGKVKRFLGKELLSHNNGGIKLIKILPNSDYPLHYHPEKTEFAFVIKGTPSFKIDGKDYCSIENDFFVFPINKSHSISNMTEHECVIIVGYFNE